MALEAKASSIGFEIDPQICQWADWRNSSQCGLDLVSWGNNLPIHLRTNVDELGSVATFPITVSSYACSHPRLCRPLALHVHQYSTVNVI